MPSNNIAFARNYTSVIDEVYQRSSVSGVLSSDRRMVRAGHNAKEILVPKISVTGLSDYTRNVGYKTGAITYEFETKSFNYDRGIRLFADVMDVEEAGVNDCFESESAPDPLTRRVPLRHHCRCGGTEAENGKTVPQVHGRVQAAGRATPQREGDHLRGGRPRGGRRPVEPGRPGRAGRRLDGAPPRTTPSRSPRRTAG